MPDKLLLVDAYSQIYRAFYAIRTLTSPQGEPVNAIFGFTKMLRKQLATQRPTHAAVVFDLGAPRARLKLLPSYKEQRPPTPPDLASQLPAIREVLAALRLPVVEQDGEEADDIIATLAVQSGMPAVIASNDKDFAQLVNDRISLLRPGDREDILFDATAVADKYGVQPSQIVDLLSLLGDNVDNIRGIPGVGPKTAVELLRQFGSVDNLLAHSAEVPRPKLREALVANAAQLRQNQRLIALDVALPLTVALPDLRVKTPDYPRLLANLKTHGFKSLVAEIDRESQSTGDLFAL